MLNSSFCQSLSSSFLQRWRPKNLLVIGLVLTFLSMSTLLLSNGRFSDNYFGVVEKLKGYKDAKPENKYVFSDPHQIEVLVASSKAYFKEVTERQSKDSTQARLEYERRYNKKVPKGWGDWYDWAQKNEVNRIDEYDDLMRWLEPFRKVPAATLKEFLKAAQKGNSMSRWIIKNGAVVGIGNRDAEVDFSLTGFPMFRGEGPWPPAEGFPFRSKPVENPETPIKDDPVPDTPPTEEPKKDDTKETPEKDDPAPEKETRQSRNLKRAALDNSQDTYYFGKRAVVKPRYRPSDDNIPQGKHPLDPFWHSKEIKSLLDPILAYLPDMDIVFNESDEPRVLLDPNYDTQKPEFEEFKIKSYHNAYEDLVGIPCSKFDNSSVVEQQFAPYLSNLPDSKEVCRHPNIANNYGMVLSPNAFSVTRSLVPLLSMSRISSVGDLTYPNVLYIEGLLNGEYDASKDSRWSSKRNDLYWTGRTSGGLANKENNWHEYHRQRFVSTINGLVNNNLSAEFQKDKELYNVRFPAVNQCDVDQCKEMTDFFSINGRPDPFNAVYRHKFQLDIDGNVFSRRFYSLMFSKSTVLKQTWQQEYFDEWLFPWVHYIPLSMDFEELPDMMRFLATTESGQKIAEEIADAGREWAFKTFRPIDASSYMYRLLLEYAELFSE